MWCRTVSKCPQARDPGPLIACLGLHTSLASDAAVPLPGSEGTAGTSIQDYLRGTAHQVLLSSRRTWQLPTHHHLPQTAQLPVCWKQWANNGTALLASVPKHDTEAIACVGLSC